MPSISVEISDQPVTHADDWERLIRRAPGNVFLHPAALNAVRASRFSRLRTLFAWTTEGDRRELVGVWALQERRAKPVGPAFLAAPGYDYAFLSNPVIDPAHAAPVCAAFLDTIETAASLPNVLRLRYLDAGAAGYAALRDVLAARGATVLTLSEHARPFATREVGVKRSGSTRKKLRQDRNRLAAEGAVEVINDRSPAAVQVALENFLALELASWKGAQRTALLSNPAHADFARRLIGALAREGAASVALLTLGGQPIAAQVLMYCGDTAYTWKTAFAVAFQRFSPGALLIDSVTEQLLAEFEAVESCSPEGSFMSQLWAGERPSVDLLVDVGPRKSLNFDIVASGTRAYEQARHLRNRLRAMSWSDLGRAPRPARSA